MGQRKEGVARWHCISSNARVDVRLLAMPASLRGVKLRSVLPKTRTKKRDPRPGDLPVVPKVATPISPTAQDVRCRPPSPRCRLPSGCKARQPTVPSAEHRAELRSHPMHSVQLLQLAGVDDGNWLDAVLRHQENEDGSDYPSV